MPAIAPGGAHQKRKRLRRLSFEYARSRFLQQLLGVGAVTGRCLESLLVFLPELLVRGPLNDRERLMRITCAFVHTHG